MVNREILVDSGENYAYELTLNDLAKTGKYDLRLLDGLKKGDMQAIVLYTTEPERQDDAFMEPLLYAVKHDMGTFKVFDYCSDRLQKSVAKEVLKEEPELIKDTLLCKDASFILKNAKHIPQIIKYVDESILEDEFIVFSLCLISDRVATEVLKSSSVDLKNVMGKEIQELYGTNGNFKSVALISDRQFISAAIQTKGTEALKYVSEEIKNDYEFLKEQSAKNHEVIEYVVDNIQDFGTEGIKGVRETSKAITMDDLLNVLSKDDPDFAIFKENLEKRGKSNPYIMTQLSCFISTRAEIKPELFKNAMNYSILTMEVAIRDRDENGEIIVDYEKGSSFISPAALSKMISKLEASGHKVDEETLKQFEEYVDNYGIYMEKIEQKKQQDAKDVAKLLNSDLSAEEIAQSDLCKYGLDTVTAAYKKSPDIKPEQIIKLLDCHLYEMEILDAKRDENGSIRNAIGLTYPAHPVLLDGLIGKLEKQGVKLDLEMQTRYEKYKEIYFTDIVPKETMQKAKPKIENKETKPQEDSTQMINSFNNTLNYALRVMEREKSKFDENGNIKYSVAGFGALMSPMDLKGLIDKLEQNSIVLSQEQRNQIDYYTKFYNDYYTHYSNIIIEEQKLSLESIVELVSTQKISDVKEKEKELVDNLQEYMKTQERAKTDVKEQIPNENTNNTNTEILSDDSR